MRIAILAIRFGTRAQQILERPADRRHGDPWRLTTFFPRQRRDLLLAELLQHQEPIGEHHQARVVMKPTPRPALEMIQAQLFLHLLVALLHRPAALPEPDRLQPTRLDRQIREGELDLAVALLLDQQPVRRGEGTLTPSPSLSRPDPDPAELPPQ